MEDDLMRRRDIGKMTAAGKQVTVPAKYHSGTVH